MEIEISESEDSQFENLEFENSEFENSEFENLEFENSELKIEKWKGLYSDWGPARKLFWDLPMSTINFGFWSTALTFCFKFGHIFCLFCTFFGPLGFIVWSFGAIFAVRFRFKNIFGTYLCSESTLVLKVQPYLFAFTLVIFGAFFHFSGPFGSIFLALWGLLCDWGQVQRHFWNLPM